MQSNRMNTVRIVALIFAVLLLLPGGCYLLIGITLFDQYADDMKAAIKLLMTAGAILSLAAVLFWVAFRRRR